MIMGVSDPAKCLAWQPGFADALPWGVMRKGALPSTTWSCPDLFRASTSLPGSGQGRVEVVPIRVLRNDEIDLPGARPVFHGPFPLDRCRDAVVAFRVNKPRETVPFGEAFDDALAVLPGLRAMSPVTPR